jgi:hypothetical protein
MPRTSPRQSTQIRQSDSYVDTLPGGESLETSAENLEDDLNAIRSRHRRFVGSDKWYEDLSHEDLKTFVHELSQEALIEITRSNNRVTNITSWNPGKSLKLRELSIDRTNGRVTQITAVIYDDNGDEIVDQRLTAALVRQNGRVANLTVTRGT